MSHDLTGLAMAPRRSSGNTATLVLLLALAMVAFLGRGYIANLASKDVAGLLGRPVSGIVIDVETGLPVAGARVLSSNSDSRTLVLTHEWSDETRTNAGGEFTVVGDLGIRRLISVHQIVNCAKGRNLGPE